MARTPHTITDENIVALQRRKVRPSVEASKGFLRGLGDVPWRDTVVGSLLLGGAVGAVTLLLPLSVPALTVAGLAAGTAAALGVAVPGTRRAVEGHRHAHNVNRQISHDIALLQTGGDPAIYRPANHIVAPAFKAAETATPTDWMHRMAARKVAADQPLER